MNRTTLALRDYQLEAQAAVLRAYNGGQRRVLMTMPTGAGKTVTFASIIEKAVNAGGRALVLAHREELIDQAARTLRLLLPDVTVGIVRAEHDQHDADVIVATVQTLRNPARLARIGRFRLIVVDEAHHSVADTYRQILEELGAFTEGKKLPKVLGVTATPDRGDGQGLADIYQSIAFEVGILPLIEQGYLSDVRAKRIILDLDLDQVTRRGGDFADGALGDAMEDAGAPEHIAQAIKTHAADRKSIVFLPTVAIAHKTAAAINALDIRAAAIDGTTPGDERRRIIDAVRSGELQAITNCMVLTEGFDAPVLDCAVMARPTSSRSLYQQSVGRVLRPYFTKKDALILDCVGVTTRHSLQSTASLFGEALDGADLQDGETATQAVERVQQEQARTLGGRVIAIDVEIFDRGNLNWIASPKSLMVLTGMRQSYAIRPMGDDQCELYRLDPHGYGHRAALVSADLPMEMAMGMAEQDARSLGFDAAAHKHMGWRNSPVTDGQRRKLWAMGYRSRKLIQSLGTSGAAANLISGIQADEAVEAALAQGVAA